MAKGWSYLPCKGEIISFTYSRPQCWGSGGAEYGTTDKVTFPALCVKVQGRFVADILVYRRESVAFLQELPMIFETLQLDKGSLVAPLLVNSCCVTVWTLGWSVHTSMLAVQYRCLLFSFSSNKRGIRKPRRTWKLCSDRVGTSADPKMYTLISPLQPAPPLLISSTATLPGLECTSKYPAEGSC